MTDHPPRITFSSHITTAQLLKQSNSIFCYNFGILLFLSLLLFSFRALVENGTQNLTAFIDRDPSLRSLLSRIDLSGHHHHRTHNINQSPNHEYRMRRRRPFLHVARGGTLDDDFFSGEDDRDRPSFGVLGRSLTPNRSFVVFSKFDRAVSFSPQLSRNGLLLPEVIRSGVQFKMESEKAPADHQENEEDTSNQRNGKESDEGGSFRVGKDRDGDRVVDLQFLIKGLELGHRDVATLFFLVSFLSAAYGWVILGFTIVYSIMLGIIFLVVINDVLGWPGSYIGMAVDGAKLGIKRLSGFVLMRWAVRDALTQLLGLWYFGDIEDQYSFFKLFVRLKLMPFSIMSPWIPGFEKQISGFLVAWFVADTAAALIFAVDAWVTIADARRTGREIVKEGCYLLLSSMSRAVALKSFEAIVCGPAAKWVLTRAIGRSFTSFLQAIAEVYFMAAWLLFYFAARSKEARLEGRVFGTRELENLANGLR